MREIVFRGKRIDNGEWIQGFLVIWGNDYYIAPDINAYTSMGGRGKGRCMMFGHYYQVLPETVGQYTGLTDKNGKKIFEGDIVSDGGFSGIVVFDDKDDGAFLVIDPFAVDTDGEFFSGLIDREVTGNIHDDPELLEIVDEP